MAGSSAQSGTDATPSGGWDDESLADPHAQVDKPARVQAMFSAIAESYDLNNRLHSIGMDTRWRRRAARLANVKPGLDDVLDVACGTGDLAMEFAEHAPRSVHGVDFTPRMIEIARSKAESRGASGRTARRIRGDARDWTQPQYAVGDAMALDLPDASVDIVSIAFGIRNVADPCRALAEFHRVLRPEGRLVILEFSLPTSRMMRGLYRFYFEHVLPWSATLISRDRTGAYRYLPRSVSTYAGPEEMKRIVQSAGFTSVIAEPFTFGICVCYVAHRSQVL